MPHRPLKCGLVEAIIRSFGFEERTSSSGTSHRQFTCIRDGVFRKVTLDCHRGEVKANDVKSIISQMGVSKKEFWALVEKNGA